MKKWTYIKPLHAHPQARLLRNTNPRPNHHILALQYEDSVPDQTSRDQNARCGPVTGSLPILKTIFIASKLVTDSTHRLVDRVTVRTRREHAVDKSLGTVYGRVTISSTLAMP